MSAVGCLLKRALKIVPNSDFEYRVLESVATNDIGNSIPVYSEWNSARGCVQPGLTFSFNARGISEPSEVMKKLGLDQAKNIMTVYAYGLNLRNVHDQDTPDQIRYKGRIFNIWSISNWYEYDGWKSLICVEDTRERLSR